MLAAFVLFATWIVLSIPGAIIGFPVTLITGDISLLYRIALGIIRTGLRAGGIRVRPEWLAPLPEGRACIFLANHVSNLDPPVVFPLIPGRAAAFLKRSLMKIPLLGYGMRLGNFIPVDRDGRVDAAVESMNAAAKVLASGIHVLSFVEGTRSRTGRLQAFKKGPFFLAMNTGAPVVPVSIYGTETMMKKGSLRIFPGTAHVIFHAPVDPRGFANRDGLMIAVRQTIASGLPEWMRS